MKCWAKYVNFLYHLINICGFIPNRLCFKWEYKSLKLYKMTNLEPNKQVSNEKTI